jgi:hypothetical protein
VISDIEPAINLGDEKTGGSYDGCKPDDFRNNDGVLKVTVHSADGLGHKKAKYQIFA